MTCFAVTMTPVSVTKKAVPISVGSAIQRYFYHRNDGFKGVSRIVQCDRLHVPMPAGAPGRDGQSRAIPSP